ncbi:MAG: UDP-glucose 4-epimerase [Thermoleophilia bacterium]|nr:UDP-glucose 4-epimerase [Thermoleophilia bacterium]
MTPSSITSPQRSVVTGGAGFIGSHLVDALVARGDDVLVIDDLSTGQPDRVHPAARFLQLDIRDAVALEQAACEFGRATWYHLAAQADVRRSVADPLTDAQINVAGTISVLAAARTTCSRVVFTSTGGAIYAAGAPRPTGEHELAEPLSPYGAAKLAAEAYVGMHARLHGLSHVVLRLANVYGPRQDPHGEAGVVAIFAGSMLAHQPVTIYGSGRQTRDFIYVGDVVEALVASGSLAPTPGTMQRFNVGTGVEVSVELLRRTIAVELGFDLGVVHAPHRVGELEHSALDASAARAQLGVALDTDLLNGIAATVATLQPASVRTHAHVG